MTREEMRRIRQLLVEWFEDLSRDLPPAESWFEAALEKSDYMPSSTRLTSSASAAVGRSAKYVL
jgi:hypothetical protein